MGGLPQRRGPRGPNAARPRLRGERGGLVGRPRGGLASLERGAGRLRPRGEVRGGPRRLPGRGPGGLRAGPVARGQAEAAGGGVQGQPARQDVPSPSGGPVRDARAQAVGGGADRCCRRVPGPRGRRVRRRPHRRGHQPGLLDPGPRPARPGCGGGGPGEVPGPRRLAAPHPERGPGRGELPARREVRRLRVQRALPARERPPAAPAARWPGAVRGAHAPGGGHSHHRRPGRAGPERPRGGPGARGAGLQRERCGAAAQGERPQEHPARGPRGSRLLRGRGAAARQTGAASQARGPRPPPGAGVPLGGLRLHGEPAGRAVGSRDHERPSASHGVREGERPLEPRARGMREAGDGPRLRGAARPRGGACPGQGGRRDQGLGVDRGPGPGHGRGGGADPGVPPGAYRRHSRGGRHRLGARPLLRLVALGGDAARGGVLPRRLRPTRAPARASRVPREPGAAHLLVPPGRGGRPLRPRLDGEGPIRRHLPRLVRAPLPLAPPGRGKRGGPRSPLRPRHLRLQDHARPRRGRRVGRCQGRRRAAAQVRDQEPLPRLADRALLARPLAHPAEPGGRTRPAPQGLHPPLRRGGASASQPPGVPPREGARPALGGGGRPLQERGDRQAGAQPGASAGILLGRRERGPGRDRLPAPRPAREGDGLDLRPPRAPRQPGARGAHRAPEGCRVPRQKPADRDHRPRRLRPRPRVARRQVHAQ